MLSDDLQELQKQCEVITQEVEDKAEVARRTHHAWARAKGKQLQLRKAIARSLRLKALTERMDNYCKRKGEAQQWKQQ